MSRLRQKFGTELSGKQVICLHIPDEFADMDANLIDQLRGGVAPHVDFGEATD